MKKRPMFVQAASCLLILACAGTARGLYSKPDGAFTCNNGTVLIDPSDIDGYRIDAAENFNTSAFVYAMTTCTVFGSWDGGTKPANKTNFPDSIIVSVNIFPTEHDILEP